VKPLWQLAAEHGAQKPHPDGQAQAAAGAAALCGRAPAWQVSAPGASRTSCPSRSCPTRSLHSQACPLSASARCVAIPGCNSATYKPAGRPRPLWARRTAWAAFSVLYTCSGTPSRHRSHARGTATPSVPAPGREPARAMRMQPGALPMPDDGRPARYEAVGRGHMGAAGTPCIRITRSRSCGVSAGAVVAAGSATGAAAVVLAALAAIASVAAASKGASSTCVACILAGALRRPAAAGPGARKGCRAWRSAPGHEAKRAMRTGGRCGSPEGALYASCMAKRGLPTTRAPPLQAPWRAKLMQATVALSCPFALIAALLPEHPSSAPSWGTLLGWPAPWSMRWCDGACRAVLTCMRTVTVASLAQAHSRDAGKRGRPRARAGERRRSAACSNLATSQPACRQRQRQVLDGCAPALLCRRALHLAQCPSFGAHCAAVTGLSRLCVQGVRCGAACGRPVRCGGSTAQRAVQRRCTWAA